MTVPYYDDGQVTIYLGDCREVTEWLAADVLVTDPPYGIRWAVRRGDCMKPTNATTITDAIRGDQDTNARDDVLTMWGCRPALVFGTWRVARPEGTRHRLIWHKTKACPGPNTSAWFPAEEEIYVLGSGFVGHPTQNVISTDDMRTGSTGLAAKIGHPTPKPVALMEHLITRCPPGAIADPFAGSGSTLIAARNLGRRAVGVELDERYCEITARRLAQDCLPIGVSGA